jgi:hypothetical protein
MATCDQYFFPEIVAEAGDARLKSQARFGGGHNVGDSAIDDAHGDIS